MDQTSADQFGAAFAEAARHWRAHLDRQLRGLGISFTQWSTLTQLRREGDGPMQRDLAKAVGMDGPTMVGVLDRLEMQNWIERRTAAHDRRAKCVFLTEAGRDLLDQADLAVHRVRRDWLQGVSQADMQAAMRVFAAIAGRGPHRPEAEIRRETTPRRELVAEAR